MQRKHGKRVGGGGKHAFTGKLLKEEEEIWEA